MEIVSNVVTAGVGLYSSSTFQADFLRASKSYTPGTDPRLPTHSKLTANLTNFANATISVADIGIFPAPDPDNNVYGAVRVVEEVILYSQRFAGNSTLAGLTRNVANSPRSTLTSNVYANSVISSLGLRTVTS
jgi:hypothetical protein